MKTFILILVLVLSVLSYPNIKHSSQPHQSSTSKNYHQNQHMKIDIDSKLELQQKHDYEIHSKGGQGKVHYQVDGLPHGVKLEGDRIHVNDDAHPGSYTIRIRAIDEKGEVDEKILTLVIMYHQVEAEREHEEEHEEEMGMKEEKDSRLVNVINSYSTVTKKEAVNYENNRFPETKFPDGPNKNSINTVPTQISSKTTSVSQQNRNKINSQDVALKAASERHQNAIKAITNLLSIIDQAKANKYYIQSQMEVYAKAYNDALMAQRRTQNQIIAIETRRTQIISAIQGVENKISEVRMDIKGLEKDRAELVSEKALLLEKLAGLEKIKAELMVGLEKINSQLASLMKELATAQEKCAGLKIQIRNVEMELKKAEEDFDSIMMRRKNAEKDVANKEGVVDELRKQLQAAENALAESKIHLTNILDEEKKMPALIAEIHSRFSNLKLEYAACQANVKRLQQLIRKTDTDDLTGQIEETEQAIIEGRKVIMEIDNALALLVEPLEKLKAQLKGAEEDLDFLKIQIMRTEEELRLAYTRGNDANTLVAHSKQNLDAVNARYKKEEKIISQATLNLERARAQEALARLAFEEIIAHYSDALPYAIVPNGNGKTPAGNPAGNNPSGSPLGPIKADGNGAPGSFKISSWTHYLSSAFGAGVHPSFKGSVTILYPFNFESVVDGNMVENKVEEEGRKNMGACGGNGPMRVMNGEVIEVGEMSFTIKLKNGEKERIDVLPCTKMNSNVANYKMKKGDEVIVKGTRKGYKKTEASQATCLEKQ